MRFPTYFLVPKSSAHFSNTQNTPGLQKQEESKKTPPQRTLKHPTEANENNPGDFLTQTFYRSAEPRTIGGCQRRGGRPGAGRAAGDPAPLKPENCVVLGHPGAPPERSICAALLLWPGLL